MIDIKTGDIVLHEGILYHSYAVGRVYGTPTAKTVMLQGWDNDDQDWSAKPSRRNRDAVKMVLPQDVDVAEFRKFVFARRQTMAAEIKAAESRFHEAVRNRVAVLQAASK